MNVNYTLKHLKYFMSVAEFKHFGKAAEACYVTQPTLSAAIKELEEILGVQLLERTKRHVLVTPVGEELLIRAKEVLFHAEGLMELAQSKQAPLSGELRLGVIPTIGPYLLPQFMGLVRKEFPDLLLYLKEDQTERLLNSLNEGHLDILILALPYQTDGIESFTFAHDDFYAAVTKDHPLSRNKHVENEELFTEDLLLLEEGHCLRDHALAACSWEGAKKSNEFAATSLSTIVQMVANGLGITLLPKLAIDAGITQGCNLVTIPLSKNSPPRDIGLVWRKTSGRGEEFRMLGQFLKENL